MQVGDTRDSFRPAAGEVPAKPGVYRFSDAHGQVLYIGKAKSLKQRLANYFGPWHVLAPRTRQMLSRATRLDWTVVASDTEALVLEQQWIRAQLPTYNVVFRDDKTFPYLVVTLGHEAPRLEITRRTGIRGAKYYGPFPKVWALKETLQLLQRAFSIRTCNDADYARAMRTGRPCLAGQIGRCHGPCSYTVTLAKHRAEVSELVRFLNTLDARKTRELTKAMQQAAAVLEFERAARLRDQITALEQVLERNAVVLRDGVSADFFGLYTDELSAAVHQFIVRDGRIRGERSWVLDAELEQRAADLIQQVLQDAYLRADPPANIYVSTLPTELPALTQVLRSKRPRSGAVTVRMPERGEKAKLLETAVRNAGEHLMRHKLKRASDLTSRTDALAELQHALGMEQPPLRIECIDVSHLQGADVVASLVVFQDALPVKAAYRKYKIAATTDDTDSIYQVVSRRAAQLNREAAQHAKSTAAASAAVRSGETGLLTAVTESAQERRRTVRPQLLLVDGGQQQVAAAARALREAGIADIALCGIAKRLEELWLPSDDYPVILPRGSEALFLVQRLRDEAHRFAITFQRQQRGKTLTSALDNIPGLGKTRVRALLKHFGSVARVRRASMAELLAVPGVGQTLAEQIHACLRDDTAAPQTDTAPQTVPDAADGRSAQ